MVDKTELAQKTVLTEKQAEAVVLATNGSEPPEIAQEMGITRQAVHTHLDRAKEKAKEAEATVEILEEIGFIE